MKYVCYIALSIFTFIVGIGISPIRFYAEMIACGSNSSSTAFRSSYFMQTTKSYISYDTEEEAINLFNAELSQALTVYDRSPKVSKEGTQIGPRAVYLTYHEGNDEYYVDIMWRDGKTLHFIHSRSYAHVMDFEKQYSKANF